MNKTDCCPVQGDMMDKNNEEEQTYGKSFEYGEKI